jgi:hypothetical protein
MSRLKTVVDAEHNGRAFWTGIQAVRKAETVRAELSAGVDKVLSAPGSEKASHEDGADQHA